MSPLLEYFTKGGPINKDNFLATLQANPGAAADVDPKTGNTPLHFVCCNGAPRDLVEPLLQANPSAAATAPTKIIKNRFQKNQKCCFLPVQR